MLSNLHDKQNSEYIRVIKFKYIEKDNQMNLNSNSTGDNN